MYSGRGIEGNRKIPVSHAANTANRVPDEIKSFGHRVIKLYLDARIKKIEEHNAKVFRLVRKETIAMREETRGMGVVVCPECSEEVHLVSLLEHRTRLCINCRV